MAELEVQEVVRLAPRIMHEIRDELSVVQTAMDFLISDETILPGIREKILTTKAQIGGAAQLARQFLIITKSEDRLVAFDVEEDLSNLTLLLQCLLGENIQLHMELGKGLWPIKLGTSQFEQIIVIVAVNARDAMPDGGALRIRATNVSEAMCKSSPEEVTPADYVLFEIIDTGIGIPARNINRIYEPFFTTKGPGCGFGLTKVYSTIEKINGHISVKSEVGKGTTFRIFLPRYMPNPVTQSS
jgi:two-component system, cell cycle sensor histidine kinase and response regulator CckA